MTLTNHLYTAGAFVVNNEWLTSLPQDVQDAIDNAARIAQEQSGKDLVSCESAMLDYMKSAGFEVTELTPEAQEEFKSRAMSMWDNANEVMGADYWAEVHAAIDEVIAGM